MHINSYGQVIRSEKEVLELLYQNPDLNINKINFEDITSVNRFNHSAKLCNVDSQITHIEPLTISLEEFDKINQQTWFIPDEYQNFDIETWLYEQCQTEDSFFRVKTELELFNQFKMNKILFIAKYLVDEFRKHNIVWGVGRGSSVASYCLFLIGLHKVDSLKYNLDITEFLK